MGAMNPNTNHPIRSILALLGALALAGTASQAETIAGTPIGVLPYTIRNSGNYHLTVNFNTYHKTNIPAILIQLNAANKDNDVVLDLNEHTIVQTNRQFGNDVNAGGYPTGIKVIGTGKGRVTIRNGTLRGFGVGIEINNGNQFLVEDMTIVGPAFYGVWAWGTCRDGVMRHNRVVGPHDGVNSINSQIGFVANTAAGMRFINNDIQDLSGAVNFAIGFYCNGSADHFFENNHVSNLTCLAGTTGSYGIWTDGAGVLIMNSRITTVGTGILISGTGKYRDNVVDNSTTPYSGGTSLGNNQ